MITRFVTHDLLDEKGLSGWYRKLSKTCRLSFFLYISPLPFRVHVCSLKVKTSIVCSVLFLSIAKNVSVLISVLGVIPKKIIHFVFLKASVPANPVCSLYEFHTLTHILSFVRVHTGARLEKPAADQHGAGWRHSKPCVLTQHGTRRT